MSRIILTVILLLALLFQFPQIAHAATISPDPIGTLTVGQTQKEIVSGLQPGKLYFWSQSGPSGYTLFNQCANADGSGNLDLFLGPYIITGSYHLSVTATSSLLTACQKDTSALPDIDTAPFTVIPTTTVCTIRTDPATLTNTIPSATFFVSVGNPLAFSSWKMRFECGTQDSGPAEPVPGPGTNEIFREMINAGGTNCAFTVGDHTITAIAVTSQGEGQYCIAHYPVQDSFVNGTCSLDPSNPTSGTYTENKCINNTSPHLVITSSTLGPIYSCACDVPTAGTIPLSSPFPTGIPATAGGSQCTSGGSPGFNTAIGCIPTNPAEFVQAVLKFVLAISGGLAFLLMLLGAFQMLTSAGNPETLQAGRDRFTQAIIGLLFIIFSVLLLQIIGVDILGLRELKPPPP